MGSTMLKENSDIWLYLHATKTTENHACHWLETSFLTGGVSGAKSIASVTNINQNSGASF